MTMSMRLYLFKCVFLLWFMLLCCLSHGRQNKADSMMVKGESDALSEYEHRLDRRYEKERKKLRKNFSADSASITFYDRRVHHYRSFWEKLIPTSSTFQFAGGMGLVELSLGWDNGRHRQWQTDLFLGYVPKFASTHGNLVVSLKETYVPWSISLNRILSLEPFSVAGYLTSVGSSDFWGRQPMKYPNDYYWFSTRFRMNLAIGQRFTINIPIRHRFNAEALSLFYEIGTNDFYIISFVLNDYVKLKDVLHLSFGVRWQFL